MRQHYAVAVDLRAVTPEMQGREDEQGQLAVMIKMSRRDDQGQAETTASLMIKLVCAIGPQAVSTSAQQIG